MIEPSMMTYFLLDLRDYGLNPEDWRISGRVLRKQPWIELQHRVHSDFRLRGEVAIYKRKKLRLKNLALKSF